MRCTLLSSVTRKMRLVSRFKRSMLRKITVYSGVMCAGLIPQSIFAHFASTQSASTQPTTGPTSVQALRRLFLQLSAADPKLREQAKMDLMGINRQDLPSLQQIAADKIPLSPQVVLTLHEIVLQVFLAGEQYPSSSGALSDASGTEGPYFLGILWQERTNELRLGAWVDQRLPGFPSYRFLRTGDMILGILIDSDVPIDQYPNSKIQNIDSLRSCIATSPQKQNITLQVLRDGEVINVALKMAPRPEFTIQMMQQQIPAPNNMRQEIDDFAESRARRAEEYWHLNFDSILESHSATTASSPLQ